MFKHCFYKGPGKKAQLISSAFVIHVFTISKSDSAQREFKATRVIRIEHLLFYINDYGNL